MKTLSEIKKDFKSKAFDGRDLNRLIQFIPENQLSEFDVTLKDEYVGKHEHVPFTKENILKQLKKDVDFGFEKALDRRGLSAEMMFEVVMMWNWILEEGLEDYDKISGYAQYGLPLFKTTALKYGFDNPIGDDEGHEFEYSSKGGY